MNKMKRKGNIMDVSLILKVAGIGMMVSIAYQLLTKYGRDEQALFV